MIQPKSPKIRLTNYPFGEYLVGDICDFGPDTNKDLVSQQRAVWIDPNAPKPPPPTPKPDTSDEPSASALEEPGIQQAADPKKVTAPKKKIVHSVSGEEDKSQKTPVKDSKSFWDRLK